MRLYKSRSKTIKGLVIFGLLLSSQFSMAARQYDPTGDAIVCKSTDQVVAVYSFFDTLEGLYLNTYVFVKNGNKYKQFETGVEFENRGPRSIHIGNNLVVIVTGDLRKGTCTIQLENAEKFDLEMRLKQLSK